MLNRCNHWTVVRNVLTCAHSVTKWLRNPMLHNLSECLIVKLGYDEFMVENLMKGG